eukprot:Seg2824.3 transcript_id=Seg2824.3/GoldUCD/mRNA.D3Y31 product="Protein hinderin" protein_id=Seg2824.3/GoldUCD/D3Y31
MSATIYWKKDDPDEFQVKDINVPGVFPKPSTKVNQDTVLASAKPWLRQRNSEHQNKDPTSRPKSAAGFGSRKSGERNAKNIATWHENKRLQQHRAELESSLDRHLRMSASLKDLCSEDKKRITNLIKELAKAGEERKTAVGALHKERLSFKDKEDLLIQQQEKLVMERDELREKILEYQFLINQYNKQIRDEKDVVERAEPKERGELQAASANSKFANESDIHAQLNDPSNIKPPLTSSESRLEKIPTYYSLPENTKDELPQAHESIAGRNMISSGEFVANVYTGSQNFAPGSASDIQRDSTVIPKAASSTPEGKLPRSEKSWDGQITLNQSHNSSVEILKEKLAMDKMQLKIQHNLLEQQQKLLQQQIQIQEQLENLQEIHKKYADEMSHVSKQRQKSIDPEKQIENLKHFSASEEELEENIKRHNPDTLVQFGKSSRENSIKKKSPMPEACPEEMHPLHRRKGKAAIYEVGHRNSIAEPTNATEMSPGFSLHSQNPVRSSYMRELKRPQRPHSTNTETPGFTAPQMQVRSRISSNKNYNKKKSMHHQSLEYQESGNSASEIESNPYGVLNQQATPFPKQKPHLRQTPRHYPVEDNDGTHLLHRTPHRSSKAKSLSKQQQQRHNDTLKQTSLLSILDTLDTESHSNENDDFDLGSYLGIPKKILEGKYSNEQIFASTDYSDDDEFDDSDLLEDLFFLKKDFNNPYLSKR